MNKDEIRNEMKARRRALTVDEVRDMSARILENLFSIDYFTCAQSVCTFLSAFKEPETGGIIKALTDRGRAVAVPITHMDTGLLTLSYIDGTDSLRRGAYGISEPRHIKEAQIEDIDAVLVPGLAFDRSGGRTGFGKGYYDRLLHSSCSVKIGLCYDFQVIESVPVQEHDVIMDFIVTEKEIIQVR